MVGQGIVQANFAKFQTQSTGWLHTEFFFTGSFVRQDGLKIGSTQTDKNLLFEIEFKAKFWVCHKFIAAD